MSTVVDRGLEGVVVGTTELSNVEGTIGRLTYRGYDIDDLAPNATFEEIVHLLLYGSLPNRHQLEVLKRELASCRALPEPLVNAMQNVPKTAWPMDVLRTVVSGLGLFSPVNAQGEHLSDVHTAIELIAKMPTIVAAWDRIRRGLDPIAPRSDLSQAGNFLYMRTGKVPHAIEEDALDTYFVLLADHSYNASTFAARVAASTRADIYASVTAALATLQGDLHGGAATAAFRTLAEVKTPENAEPYVRESSIAASGSWAWATANTRCAIRAPAISKRWQRSSPSTSAEATAGTRPRTRSKRRAARCCKRKSPATRSTRTSTSTPRRCSPISAFRATSSPVSSRAAASPAGPATSSSSSPTIGSFARRRRTKVPRPGRTCRSSSARRTARG